MVGGSGHHQAPAALPPGKNRSTDGSRAGLGDSEERTIFAPAGTQTPDRSARLDIPDRQRREDIFTSKKNVLFFNEIFIAQAKSNYYRHDNGPMHIHTVQATYLLEPSNIRTSWIRWLTSLNVDVPTLFVVDNSQG